MFRYFGYKMVSQHFSVQPQCDSDPNVLDKVK